MKIFNLIVAVLTASAVLAGCVKNAQEECGTSEVEMESGMLSVRLMYEGMLVKSGEISNYLQVLDEEKAVKKISILVFDESTGMLNASMDVKKVTDDCKLTIPVGRKIVYSVVNGPELGYVTRIGQMSELVDDLSNSNMAEDGLTMIGSEVCDVKSGEISEPVVVVRWLVSRVVLRKVECNVATQYGGMKVDCVYLGNANTVQYGSGTVGGMVNPDGYADAAKQHMIGKNDILGSCPEYMYRNVGVEIPVGGVHEIPSHMYCQPNATSDHTCLYLLATIGGVQYYYRVPLNKGLVANHTCSVDVNISNLGSLTPPEDDYQNGAVQAVVEIEGWTPGNSYVAEF